MGYIAPPPPLPGESEEDYMKRYIEYYKKEAGIHRSFRLAMAICGVLTLLALLAALIVKN